MNVLVDINIKKIKMGTTLDAWLKIRLQFFFFFFGEKIRLQLEADLYSI